MRQPAHAIPILGLLAASIFFTSLMVGRYPISIVQVFRALLLHGHAASGDSAQAIMLVRQVRVSRVATAMLVGASLASSGAAYQGVFRNPLVSPDILGASAGAGFGAAVAILLSLSTLGIQSSAFVAGLVAVGIACFAASRLGGRREPTVVLILAGMAATAVFSSLLSLTKYVADPGNKLPVITFWLMGSLSSVVPRDIPTVGAPFVLGIVPLFLVRWRLNVLSLGDDEARALGVNVARLRWVVVLCSTFMTASSISVCGMVGWVGLKIPHLARMLVGPDFTVLLPASTLLGAAYLAIVDDLARSLGPMEIPLGILTSLIGAPVFLWLVAKARRTWG
jgi:iron complex transport system permease protein